MPEAVDIAHERVMELAHDFDRHHRGFVSPDYSEAQARQDFIDKLLSALGWDVHHTRQRNPFEQEVKVERNVSIGGASQRRADYALYISPNFRDVRLYVEAKKPRGTLATADNYFQAIRYGWNSQTPVAVLTSFEELHIIDCRYKPNVDTALQCGIKTYHFKDYERIDKFSEIYYLISREAVASGSLDRFAASLPKRRGAATQRGFFKGGYQPIDVTFLEEIDGHREVLARSFKSENPELDGEALTELTQRVLDRLVFLRFLEDKQIESRFRVADFGNKGSVWGDFISASRRLDATYNGIVFKEHPLLDDQARIAVDEKAFGDVCEDLSHVNSPYDFNVIPIHILGSIYERFLGKVIEATPKRARLVEKPEVRKAGGVYYTPEYVVRYIVEATLRPLIEGKTPAQIAGMRFIDIACGSGSFLLGAYDYLLRYHRQWFNDNKQRLKPVDYVEHDDGTLHLSLKTKRIILINNIFGVDVDAQAVEVAQLSLYLKLLEEETPASARNYQLELHEAVLPSLSANVVCGNSLVGTDVLSGDLLGDDVERRWNAMDFADRFPTILKGGGFDAVIGNPPYVRPHNLSAELKEYLWSHYKTFTHKSDIYCCFMEQSERLLRQGGRLGYIVSHGWLRLNSFQELRKLVLERFRIEEVVELPYKVFADAQVETGIAILQKESRASQRNRELRVMEGAPSGKEAYFSEVRKISQSAFSSTFQNVFDLSMSPQTELVKNKMRGGPTIGSVFDICFGLKSGDDSKFLHFEKGRHKEDKPLLRGENVKRYGYEFRGEYVWYVPKRMREHRSTARPGEAARFEQPKVLVKDTSTDFSGTYDSESFYVKDVLIVVSKPGTAPPVDLRFLTALINSRALHFYYRTTFKTLHVQVEELGSLPLPNFVKWSRDEQAAHDRIVELVDQMLEIQKKRATAVTDKDLTYYEKRSEDTDRRIDQLVYDIYGLTSEDVNVIEGR